MYGVPEHCGDAFLGTELLDSQTAGYLPADAIARAAHGAWGWGSCPRAVSSKWTNWSKSQATRPGKTGYLGRSQPVQGLDHSDMLAYDASRATSLESGALARLLRRQTGGSGGGGLALGSRRVTSRTR